MSEKSKVSKEEMDALASITPQSAPISEDTETQKIKDLGKVDLSPKFNRDERLNQLQWIEVNKELMSYQGMFYPLSWTFKCRAAWGAEVANFSSIDNEDPLSVNDGINELLKTCLRIEKNGAPISYKNLHEMDRLWFVLFIRDLTMANPEQIIQYETQCTACGEANTVKLTFDSLVFRDLSDIAKKYFDRDECVFNVQTKSFGVLTFEPTTIRRAEIFKDWMVEESRNHRKPNATFAKLFWMLINKSNEQEKDVTKTLYQEYIALSNNTKKLSLYLKLNEELQTGLSEQLTYVCEHCGKEVHADIRFPDGINNLLLMSDIDSELL